MQETEKPPVSNVDLKEEITREPKAPVQPLRGNGRIVEYTSVRRRLTRGIVKHQAQSWLVDTYEHVAETLRRVRNGEMELGPATLARVKKIYNITRAELKRRGATDEELDYQPEADATSESGQPMEAAA